MLWLIAKKEFLLNLISARFIIGFLLCLVIIPFTVIVNVDNYLNQVGIYKIEKERADREYKEIRVWSMLRPTVVSEPEVLSIFSNGISGNMGNKTKIQLNVYPLFPSGHVITNDNPLLNAFFSIDFSRVIAILISLIALVFSYDAITREREEGTMKQCFTGKISRITFLFGKITGLVITLLPILLFCYILACLIVMVNPGISISASDWGGIMLLFLTSIIYMMVFILIGILISSLTSRSSTSIILSLLCWIWFLFLLPNISTYLSQSIVKTPLDDNVQNAIREYDKELSKGEGDVWRRAQKEFHLENGISHWNYSGGEDGMEEMSGITKEVALLHRQVSIWETENMLSYADKKWAIQRSYLDELIRQQKWQQRIAWLSPSEIFGQATNALCRTDMQSFLKYMESVRNFRETFIRYYSDKKLFESFAYFTGHSFESLYSEEDVNNMASGEFFKIMKEKEINNSMFPLLNTDDVPRYVSQPDTLSMAISGAMGRLTALLALMVALLFVTIVTFMKYDVR
jgi:ABC-type transport system involved in multi-copper enzyme maturation permease subunit